MEDLDIKHHVALKILGVNAATIAKPTGCLIFIGQRPRRIARRCEATTDGVTQLANRIVKTLRVPENNGVAQRDCQRRWGKLEIRQCDQMLVGRQDRKGKVHSGIEIWRMNCAAIFIGARNVELIGRTPGSRRCGQKRSAKRVVSRADRVVKSPGVLENDCIAR